MEEIIMRAQAPYSAIIIIIIRAQQSLPLKVQGILLLFCCIAFLGA